MEISFENNHYGLHAFLEHCKSAVTATKWDDWQHEIFQFFIDWHDKSSTISVSTSGSTGKAKIISIEKKHMLASAQATLNHLEIETKGLAWLCVPARYIAGKMMIVRALAGNLDLLITKPQAKPELTVNRKISLAAMVPVQAQNLFQDTGSKEIMEQVLQNLLIGGSSIHKNLESLLRNTKSIKIWQTYGMTETISHIAMRRLNATPEQKCYSPLPGVSLQTGALDCLIISYPEIGVYNLKTNDMASLNTDHTFTITGRADYIINTGGIKINPEAVEKKLEEVLPYHCCLTSISGELAGEKLVLCIEGNQSLLSGICALWKTISETLLKHEIPSEIRFFQPFDRNENGKLDRSSIKEKLLTFTQK